MADLMRNAVLAGVAAGGGPQEVMGVPQMRPPFQQSSIPGAIIGALLSGSTPGRALLQNIDAYRNRGQVQGMMSYAAGQLRAIGTPEAARAADMLLRDPRSSDKLAQKLYGGWGNWFSALQSRATQQRNRELVQQWREETPDEEETGRSLGLYLSERIAPSEAFKLAEQYGKLEEDETSRDPLFKLIDNYNRALSEGSDPNSQFMQLARARMQKLSQQTGTITRVNPDGSLEVIQGATMGGGAGLEKPTRSMTEKDLYNLSGQMQAINNVMGQYRREYQQLPTQLLQYAMSKAEWLGADLTPEQKAAKLRYQSYRSDVFDELNRMLNMLSGAAVTEHEMKRLKQSMPSIDNSPTDFEGKAASLRRRIAQSIARANYTLRTGMKVDDVPMGRMDKLIESRLNKYGEQFVAQGMSAEEAETAADQAILREFGVRYEDVMLPWEQ